MAYNKNSVFYKEFTQGGIEYRLEFTPADGSILSSPTEVEFPEFSLITTNFGTVADYDGLVAIGIHNSKEISFEMVGDAFTGDWQDVFEWITAGGVAVTSDYITSINNKWVLYIKRSGVYEMVYTGFQITNGAGAVYKFNTQGSVLTYEVKVQDVMRAVLSDIPLTANMADFNLDEYKPDLIVQHDVTSADGHHLWVLDEAFSAIDANFYPSYPGKFKSIGYDNLISNFGGAIVIAMYNKFRVNPTALADSYFDGDFLDGYTFYSHDSTYNATDTKGSAIAQADLKLVAQKSNSDGEFDWNIMIDGIFAKGNMYDLLLFLSQNFCKKITLNFDVSYGFPKLVISHLYEYDQEYYFTDSNVLNEFEIAQSQDISAMQYFHFSNVSSDDINNTKFVGDATLLRQDSYEIDSVIDNYKSNIEIDKDNLVYLSSGQNTIGATNSHLNCFFELKTTGNFYYLYGIHNSVTYRGTDYGAIAKNPVIVDIKWGNGDLTLLNEYIQTTQNYDQLNPYTSGNGVGAVFVDVLSSYYGLPANPHTATIKVNADDFDLSKFGCKVHFDYADFVGNLPDFGLNIPTSGFLVGIDDFNIATNTYTCTIILNL